MKQEESKVTNIQDAQMHRELERQVQQHILELKKKLKTMSKNDLIRLATDLLIELHLMSQTSEPKPETKEVKND